jgi:SAM-dependent methyltransferase
MAHAEMKPATDPFAQFKAIQREGWSLFTPTAIFTTPSAAALVEWAGIKRGDAVLDVACGTGVVAVTAHLKGARVKGLDLSPVLLEEARKNATIVDAAIEFTEGDAEALPYRDGEFDVVVSQFGHMFAPRHEVVVREMLRVLKPGGRIAFSTWPPELLIGQVFKLTSSYLPPLPPGATPPPTWGVPETIRERLGDAVDRVEFHRDELQFFALSPAHYRSFIEKSVAPAIKVVQELSKEPARLARFRADFESLIAQYFERNRVRQSYLMTRAIKK